MAPAPPKPAVFAVDAAPPGIEYRHVLFTRPKLRARARIILIHTNAAERAGSIQSAWNYAHARPNENTCPTYQVDLSGAAAKFLASDEDAIANCTVADFEDGHGDVSEYSIAIETADTGTIADATISAFTPEQVESISYIVAYEAVINDIPIETPTEWFGAGVAAHTDPFGYPLWTCRNGKTCPGDKKKAQVRELILPRAREIVAAWFPPPPPPPPDPPEEEEDMKTLYVGAYQNDKDDWDWWEGDLTTRSIINQGDLDQALRLAAAGHIRYLHMATLEPVEAGQKPRAITWRQVRRLGSFDTRGQLGPEDS